MMKKRCYYLLLVMGFLAGGFATIAFAQPDILKIENKYTKRLKASVTLNHKKHADTISCSECHHEWKKEEKKPPQICNECHKEKVEEKKVGLKNAYHNTCTGCHKKLTAQGKNAGPTVKCVDCHPKGK